MPTPHRLNCCGITELSNIVYARSANSAIYDLIKNTSGNFQGAFVVFSEVRYHDNTFKKGDKIKAYIEKNKLGKVICTEPKINPNTGGLLKMYTWTVAPRKIHDWFLKITKEKEARRAARAQKFMAPGTSPTPT